MFMDIKYIVNLNAFYSNPNSLEQSAHYPSTLLDCLLEKSINDNEKSFPILVNQCLQHSFFEKFPETHVITKLRIHLSTAVTPDA